jgi:hypothetical protein
MEILVMLMSFGEQNGSFWIDWVINVCLKSTSYVKVRVSGILWTLKGRNFQDLIEIKRCCSLCFFLKCETILKESNIFSAHVSVYAINVVVWTVSVLYESWYAGFAFGGHLTAVLWVKSFLTLCEVGVTLSPFTTWPWNDVTSVKANCS